MPQQDSANNPMTQIERCSTCGRPRGIAQKRQSWSLDFTILVPRTDNPDDTPLQIANDLICYANVSRNGGTSERIHLCDDCLRMGLRAIQVRISALLGELDAGIDKDAQIAELTQKLGSLQLRHYDTRFAHNRMQDRLSAVLAYIEQRDLAGSEALKFARWEVARGHIETQ